MITIITRTSNRPALLERLIKTIVFQSYKDITHLILADNNRAVDYTTKICHKLKYKAKVVKVKKESNNNGFYNLYLNTGIQLVNEGWIMFVDDDDYLIGNCIEKIMTQIKDENRIYICQYLRSYRAKPMKELFKNINYQAGQNDNFKCGNIGGGCLIFKKSQVKGCLWDDRRCSDFRFIKQMTAINNYTFIPIVAQRTTPSGNKGENLYK